MTFRRAASCFPPREPAGCARSPIMTDGETPLLNLEREMQYLGFALFVVAAAAGAWFLGHAMTSAGRNQGSTHGGGIDEETGGASDYHFLSGTADGGDA